MQRRDESASALALLAALAMLADSLGCGSQSTQSVEPTPELLMHVVDPATTDPAISSSYGSHQAFLDSRVVENGRLLLFLPGAGAPPGAYQKLLTDAAGNGYHALGLAYPNSESVSTLCDGDPSCYEPVRREIFDGVDLGDRVSVDEANSVRHRAVELLRYLDASFHNESWGRFVDGDDLRYDQITVAGHSQGGDEAAFIGKIHTVGRVAMLSAPVDAVDGGPAPWIDDANETPAIRYYGFAHEADPAFDDITTSWQRLGMGAASDRVLVDSSAAPYGGARQLETAVPVDHPHDATAADADTPTTVGTPVFRDVWRTLFGP